MAQDLHPIGIRHCFACLQWDGRRTYEAERKLIKADAGSIGTCRVKHSAIKGSSYCPNYFPLR